MSKLTKERFEALKASIERDWPKARYPGMHEGLMNELTAQYEGRETFGTFADSLEEVARNAEAPAPAAAAPASGSRTTPQYDQLVTNAIMAGVDPEVAQRRAQVAIAVTKGEQPRVDIEGMSAAELKAFLAADPGNLDIVEAQLREGEGNAPDRTSPEAMAEDIERFAQRRESEQAARRHEQRYNQLMQTHASAIEQESQRYGVDSHTALGYLIGDMAVRLDGAGRHEEAEAEKAAWRWADEQSKASASRKEQTAKLRDDLNAQAGVED